MGKIERIIWIDDDEKMMQDVVSDVFEELWQMQIRSEIFIMGDDCSENNQIDHNSRIVELNRVTYDRFISFLISNGSIDNENSVKSYWPLINSNKEIQPYSDIVTNNNDIIESNCEIIDKWKASTIIDKMPSTETIVDAIIQRIGTDGCLNVMIMIDLCLLKGDYKKLSSSDDQFNTVPIFSTSLYNEFIKKGLEEHVGLYSTFVTPNDVVEKWTKIYTSQFGNNEIAVYNRKGNLYNNFKQQKALINRIKGMG